MACRELDSEIELLTQNGQSRRPRMALCQPCLGTMIAARVMSESGPNRDRTVTVLVRPVFLNCEDADQTNDVQAMSPTELD